MKWPVGGPWSRSCRGLTESLPVCKPSSWAHLERPSLSIYLLVGSRKCPIPTHNLIKLQEELDFGNLFAAVLPQPTFPTYMWDRGPYNSVLLLFLFASHFLSPEHYGSYNIVGRKWLYWKHLKDKETGAQSSKEPCLWSYIVSRQPSGISDFQVSLRQRPHLMANPHSVLGAGWWQASSYVHLVCLVSTCIESYYK